MYMVVIKYCLMEDIFLVRMKIKEWKLMQLMNFDLFIFIQYNLN